MGIANVPETPYAQIAIARFLPDGILDTSFGNNGLTLTHVSNAADEPASPSFNRTAKSLSLHMLITDLTLIYCAITPMAVSTPLLARAE